MTLCALMAAALAASAGRVGCMAGPDHSALAGLRTRPPAESVPGNTRAGVIGSPCAPLCAIEGGSASVSRVAGAAPAVAATTRGRNGLAPGTRCGSPDPPGSGSSGWPVRPGAAGRNSPAMASVAGAASGDRPGRAANPASKASQDSVVLGAPAVPPAPSVPARLAVPACRAVSPGIAVRADPAVPGSLAVRDEPPAGRASAPAGPVTSPGPAVLALAGVQAEPAGSHGSADRAGAPVPASLAADSLAGSAGTAAGATPAPGDPACASRLARAAAAAEPGCLRRAEREPAASPRDCIELAPGTRLGSAPVSSSGGAW